MQLTQQRLQLVGNEQTEYFRIKTEQLKTEEGQICGTCVSIKYPL